MQARYSRVPGRDGLSEGECPPSSEKRPGTSASGILFVRRLGHGHLAVQKFLMISKDPVAGSLRFGLLSFYQEMAKRGKGVGEPKQANYNQRARTGTTVGFKKSLNSNRFGKIAALPGGNAGFEEGKTFLRRHATESDFNLENNPSMAFSTVAMRSSMPARR